MSDGSETIRLCAELYRRDAIERTAETFGSLATFAIEEGVDEGGRRQVTVAISEVREDVRDRIVDEFFNHALEETILLRRHGAAR